MSDQPKTLTAAEVLGAIDSLELMIESGGGDVDCYDVQRAWIACNEAVPPARAPAAGCDCSAQYAAVVACAPTGR